MAADTEDKKDVKSTSAKTAANTAYRPGYWQDWGKSGGRKGRAFTEQKTNGLIGTLRVHRSGRVKLHMGHGKKRLAHDVSHLINP